MVGDLVLSEHERVMTWPYAIERDSSEAFVPWRLLRE